MSVDNAEKYKTKVENKEGLLNKAYRLWYMQLLTGDMLSCRDTSATLDGVL